MTLDLVKLREVAELAVETGILGGTSIPHGFTITFDPQTVLALLDLVDMAQDVVRGDGRHESIGHRASGTSPSLMKLREAFREMQQPERDNG